MTEMNDDAFDEIVNNQPDDDAPPDVSTLWDALTALWPKFYPGMLLKGVLVAEYLDEVDGRRTMLFSVSPEVAPWDMLGLLESAQLDARIKSVQCTQDAEEDDPDAK